jgi:hypothetical protein
MADILLAKSVSLLEVNIAGMNSSVGYTKMFSSVKRPRAEASTPWKDLTVKALVLLAGMALMRYLCRIRK